MKNVLISALYLTVILLAGYYSIGRAGSLTSLHPGPLSGLPDPIPALETAGNPPPTGFSKTRAKFMDPTITFDYPLPWYQKRIEVADPAVAEINFSNSCNRDRIITFSYTATNPRDYRTMLLARKNPNGPAEQSARIVTINGITAGENIQPETDGSGGYEPKVVIDFLSPSKRYHYYFTAVKGCRNSAEETYKWDLMPILLTVNLLDY